MRKSQGFTLIEMLVTVTVLVVVLSMALPNLRLFIQRNAVASLSNEFNGALLQARAMAISNNACTTLCASSGTLGANPQCSAQATDFNPGWILFINRACDSTQVDPTAANGSLVSARAPGQGTYAITMSADTLRRVDFSPRGTPMVGDGRFTVVPPDGLGPEARMVCLQASGRSTVRAYDAKGC